MKMKVFEQKDLEAFLAGMSTYGTGGGGNPEIGRAILENDFAAGRKHLIVDPADVPDDAFICSGGIMGSVKSLDEEGNDKRHMDGDKEPEILVKAIRMMEEHHDRKLDYIIPFEVGGSNTPVIMSVAARMGIPMIDGDGVGRAAPETQMTSWIGHGISLTPMPLVDMFDNKIIVMHGVKSTYSDFIGRFVVVNGGNSGANAHYPMNGKQLKESCIPNILSKALELGKMQLSSFEKGVNCADKVQEFLGADKKFVGRIESEEGIDKGGFYLTEIKISGIGAFAGHSTHMVLKNETMALWIDEKLQCMFPDYIFMIDPNTGLSYQTARLKRGMDIELLCAPCHPRLQEALRTEVGLESFSATRYGCSELEYRPYEVLQGGKR